MKMLNLYPTVVVILFGSLLFMMPSYTVFASPVVEFDKDAYTWNERAEVIVISPLDNIDRNGIETIGGESAPITIQGDGEPSHEIKNYRLVETGPDTGIFAGSVQLVKSSDQFDTYGEGPNDGYLEVNENSTIKVSFASSFDQAYSTSAPISQETSASQTNPESLEPHIVWYKGAFSTDETGKLRVYDSEMNNDSDTAETFEIEISSTSGSDVMANVTETSPDSGIFEGEVSFTTNPDEAADNTILAAEDDRIHASHDTNTGQAIIGSDNMPEKQDDTSQPPPLNTTTPVAPQGTQGTLQWLHSEHSVGEPGTIRVADPDMNIDPQVVETLEITVYSDTDQDGINMTITETGNSTGVFEGQVFFTETGTSEGTILLISGGDSVTALYKDQSTDSGSMDISATTEITLEYYPPYAQLEDDIPLEEISCMDESHKLFIKDESKPLCLSEETFERLSERDYFDSDSVQSTDPDVSEGVATPEIKSEQQSTKPSDQTDTNTVIAEVNGEEIYLQELRQAQATSQAQTGQGVESTVLLDQLITNEILLQEAENRDISVTTQEAKASLEEQIEQSGMTTEEYETILQEQGMAFEDTMSAHQEQLTINELLADETSSGSAVSESEKESFFDENIDAIKSQFGEDVAYEDVADMIESTILQQKQQGDVMEFVSQLRGNAEIITYEDRFN